jgi:hypothetical protein
VVLRFNEDIWLRGKLEKATRSVLKVLLPRDGKGKRTVFGARNSCGGPDLNRYPTLHT